MLIIGLVIFISFSAIAVKINNPNLPLVQSPVTLSSSGINDTNATTECADTEFLRGDGTCIDESTFGGLAGSGSDTEVGVFNSTGDIAGSSNFVYSDGSYLQAFGRIISVDGHIVGKSDPLQTSALGDDPTLRLYSGDEDSDEWIQVYHNGNPTTGGGIVEYESGKLALMSNSKTVEIWDGLQETFMGYRGSSSYNQFAIYNEEDAGRQFIFTDDDFEHKDHNHPVQNNPTVYVHSGTDVDTDDTQWVSLTHDTSDAVADVGSGGFRIGLNDSVKLFLGQSKDAAFSYNGSDLIINPDEVGSGSAYIDGDVIITGTVYGGSPLKIGSDINNSGGLTTNNITLSGEVEDEKTGNKMFWADSTGGLTG